LDSGVLEGVKKVIALMEAEGVPPQAVTVDFGLARGLAYYTGIVFEIQHADQETSLGGGGRYDGLARALGSRTAIPALGFAYTAESLVEALEAAGKEESVPQARKPGVLLLASGESSYRQAARLARDLRASGKQVEMDVCGAGLEESLAYARARGLAEVIEVDGAGRAKAHPVDEAPRTDRRKGARPVP
jgi:histidyl-tRNA synthetase